MNLDMKFCGDLVLREKCDAVSEITPEILDALDQMVDMMDDQKGVGLAAPQVGILKRFLVMVNPDTKEVLKMINPVITKYSDKKCNMEEGCLSVLNNDGVPIYSHVSRPESVTVEWFDESGQGMRAEMSGYPARIVQHEYDHLDGVLFVDHLSPVKREQVMRKVRKLKK